MRMLSPKMNPKKTTGSTGRKPRAATPSDRIPRRVMQPSLGDHLEIITRAIFQAGLSWAAIAARWDRFREAFEGFDVVRVAAYTEGDVDRLMHADGMIHSAKKIIGTIENAKALVCLERDFGSVANYAARFGSYADLAADARERFAFMGDLSCYYWLFRAGYPVPRFERLDRRSTQGPSAHA